MAAGVRIVLVIALTSAVLMLIVSAAGFRSTVDVHINATISFARDTVIEHAEQMKRTDSVPPPNAATVDRSVLRGRLRAAQQTLVRPVVPWASPTLPPPPPPIPEAMIKQIEAFSRAANSTVVVPTDRDTDPFDAHRVDVVLPVCNRPGNGVSAACDPLAMTFSNEKNDTDCRNYLADMCNWYGITAMPGHYRGSRPNRTKFLVHYRDRRVRAMLRLLLDFHVAKVSDRPFPGTSNNMGEAASEMYSYFTDRILGLHYIPPTGWARDIPVDYLRASIGALQAATPFHAQYFERYLAFAATSPVGLVKTINGSAHVSGCVQLWMDNLVPFDESDLANVLTVNNKTSLRQLLSFAGVPLNTLRNLAKERKGFAAVLTQLSDIFAFDFIVGQRDRSLKSNLWTFRRCEGCPEKSVRFAMIDQGYTFGPSGSPSFHQDSPFDWRPELNADLCRLSGRLQKSALAQNGKLLPILRALVAEHGIPLHSSAILIASRRLRRLSGAVLKCRREHNEDVESLDALQALDTIVVSAPREK